MRVDRPDPAGESGDVGMAGNARPFDESARAEVVCRQYDIDNGHRTAKEPGRETVTFAMRRAEAEDGHRHLTDSESQPTEKARLAKGSDGRDSVTRSGSIPDGHGGTRGDRVIPDNGSRESCETDADAADGEADRYRASPFASYRATVYAVYDSHQAEVAESAVGKTRDGDFGSWNYGDGQGRSSTESAECQEYRAHYQAVVEVEYKDAHWSRDSGESTLRQPSAGSERKFLHADADPLRVFGPASETHPEGFQKAMMRLVEAGVEVDLRPGSMSYSPAAGGDRPGRLILDPEASYGAVLHELSHFSDDELAGFPGLRYWLEDQAVTADGESRAYQAEIDYANSIGEPGIVDQLEYLRAQRIGQLIGENNE